MDFESLESPFSKHFLLLSLLVLCFDNAFLSLFSCCVTAFRLIPFAEIVTPFEALALYLS